MGLGLFWEKNSKNIEPWNIYWKMIESYDVIYIHLKVGLDQRLNSMILEGFSNLNDSEILCI